MVLAAVSILSAAVIAYEILLMRLFSIVQWHHFAYMVISLALLGYGVSGTVLTLARAWLLARFRISFAAGAAGFALLAPAVFLLAQRLAFNPLELIWDRAPWGILALIYLLLALPFLGAAMAIGLALSRRGARIGTVYFADLLGAGVGAPAVIALMFWVPPQVGLKAIAAAGLVAAALALIGERRGPALAALALAAAMGAPWPPGWLALEISPYKGLSQSLNLPGRAVVAERSNPLGALSLVEAGEVPFRHAPGLSLTASAEIPDQVGLFIDGDALSAVTRFDGDLSKLAYLDQQTAALPFHLYQRPAVLVLGAGGGAGVLRALYHGARRVDAVELNGDIPRLIRGRLGAFSGHLFDRPDVSLHIGEARAYAAHATRRHDIIQISLLDSFSAAAAGLYALNESTLYTVEALRIFLDRLKPGGVLAITRWLKDPPREVPRLFATAIAALPRGVAARRLALIRGWDTATLLVKQDAFTAADIERIKSFTRARGFDPAYYPGMAAAEANRRNILDRAYLHEAATALLGPDAAAYISAYRYDISPTTDDRPYFFHTLKLGELAGLLALKGAGRVALIEWGYVILLLTFGQAVIASVVLILLPLKAVRRPDGGSAGGGALWALIYFAALGLAFLFLEIVYIQFFTLYLGHPLFAVTLVLSTFLIFAGIGAAASQPLARRFGARRTLLAAVAGLIALAALYLLVWPPLMTLSLGPGALWPKIVIAVVMIAPLALCMGMPFPLGLTALSARAPHLVPWAWSINGCASVVSAVLATLLAIEFGFTVVVAAALLLYAVAAAVFREGPRAG